jgi:hypothetical protein
MRRKRLGKPLHCYQLQQSFARTAITTAESDGKFAIKNILGMDLQQGNL